CRFVANVSQAVDSVTEMSNAGQGPNNLTVDLHLCSWVHRSREPHGHQPLLDLLVGIEPGDHFLADITSFAKVNRMPEPSLQGVVLLGQLLVGTREPLRQPKLLPGC